MTSAKSDSELITRIWGDPNTTGRQLQLDMQVAPDGSQITFNGTAIDGTSAIVAIEYQTGPGTFVGSGKVLGQCTNPPNPCSIVWPYASMIAGNNDFSMVATNAAKQRFFVVGKISRPTLIPPGATNFLLCDSGYCLDDSGMRLTAN